MLCFLQLGLAVLGVQVMRMPTIRVGKQVAYAPFPFLIGLVLVAQFAICLLYGFKVGYEEGQKALKEGRKDVDIVSIQSRNLWVDICSPVGGLCLCGILLFIGLREPIKDEYPGVPEWKKKLLKKMQEESEKDIDEYVREEPPVLPTRPDPDEYVRRPRRGRDDEPDETAESTIDLTLYTDTPARGPIRRRRWRHREGK